MIKKVADFIDENSLFNNGDRVIVAVSGGPDSLCLLHILHILKKKYNMEIYVAHVNHGLRGKDADDDERYVSDFCEKIEVKFFSKKVELYQYAKQRGMSCETAGREVRYEFFEDLRKELMGQKIALAHNANDQAETILMRIMRGTGIDGLRGIRPIRDGIFVRPILNLSRDEIEEYCSIHNLNPRIDSSNLENIYNRNKVRLELIPFIKNNFNKDIVNTLNRFSKIITTDSEFLEELSEEKYKRYCKTNNNDIILCKEAFNEKEAILTRIVRRALLALRGNLNNFETIHIYDVIHLQKQSTGKYIMLPQGVLAENIYGDIHIYSDEKGIVNKSNKFVKNLKRVELSFIEKMQEPLHIFIEENNLDIYFRIVIYDENMNFTKDNLTKYFDCDKIKNEIIIRTRQDGDKFIPYGMRGSKKLKDFFIDLKIPKDKRDHIPLLCLDEDIAWVIGYRISDVFKVDKNTSRILEVSIKGRGNKNDE